VNSLGTLFIRVFSRYSRAKARKQPYFVKLLCAGRWDKRDTGHFGAGFEVCFTLFHKKQKRARAQKRNKKRQVFIDESLFLPQGLKHAG
jgi:hypothetical protein